MSKRYMPSLEGLDNGERPVLGIVETHDLADAALVLPEGFTIEMETDIFLDPNTTVVDLFDPYE